MPSLKVFRLYAIITSDSPDDGGFVERVPIDDLLLDVLPSPATSPMLQESDINIAFDPELLYDMEDRWQLPISFVCNSKSFRLKTNLCPQFIAGYPESPPSRVERITFEDCTTFDVASLKSLVLQLRAAGAGDAAENIRVIDCPRLSSSIALKVDVSELDSLRTEDLE